MVFACMVGLLAGCTVGGASPGTPPATDATATAQGANAAEIQSSDPEKAEAVMQIVRDYMEEAHLKAVILRVTVDGEEIVTAAAGRVDDGRAGHDRHALPQRRRRDLLHVDTDAAAGRREEVTLDDKLSTYLPDLRTPTR